MNPSDSNNDKEHTVNRKLAAIMFTDMVGYSALSQQDELLAIDLLNEHRKILREIFIRHNGIEIETIGDAFFVEFKSAVEAADCAIEIQESLNTRNQSIEKNKAILLRIGLHIGDVIFYEKHVHGDGVNIASRLEPLSPPGGICLSEDFARAIHNKISYPLILKGKTKLKNISEAVTIYLIQLPWLEENKISNNKFSIFRGFAKGKHFYKGVSLYVAGAVPVIFLVFVLFFNTGEVSATNNRIAVLPFLNISNDLNDDFFADGITEEIISNLAKISGLDVIARTSVMRYKNTHLNVAQIGSELMVGIILEGSVRKDANKTRITVQLIDVHTQKHLWSEDYDRELKDIFAIQSDIAMNIAEELKVQLLANEKEQIEKRGTENAEAYRYYLLGNYFLNRRTGDALNKGIENFQKAIQHDPQFPHAYAGLANCYTLIGGASYGNLSREDASQKAKTAVLKALEIDESLAEAHASLAYIKFRFDWDWKEAEAEFKKAIAQKPGYAQAYEWYALLLSLTGKYDEALIEMKRAYALDPLSASISTGLGRILDFSGRHDEAISQYKKTLEMYPAYAEAHFALSMSYGFIRKTDEAFVEIDEAIKLSNGRPIMIATKGMIYGFAGRKKEALAVIDELKTLLHPYPVSPWYLSSIYLSVGDKDKFFEYAEKAYEQKDPLMVYFKTIADTNLQMDPRFNDLLSKMGFDQ